ncbi:MAG: DNA repair protein RecN [Paludibacteraceae bacterium]|nr:DNA repair protein RecN [Paludibacteraceae bacterium]MBP8966199.1 DNA repair protein RecN [Paludibacteraceae bacterium]OPZ02854.1 MAG: DNA repair protein RecN [Bacteroidetes bacterium ADurb.BinA395]HOF98227.1 DNA repair protein RecN [Paludibacteraceae bacterium]HOJ65746.1 DNA repair protein RecN [Paludibacteraceae bacterium]
MLKTLHISNYALISEINIGFNSGFSVITGETGAGKSIIIGALSLILGQRAESRFIKEGEEKAIVEAEFDIRDYRLEHFFEINELDFHPEQCIIRREITASGKSRAFINDTPVSLQLLRELSAKLIDIHSQHENLLLSDDQYQLQVVDNMAQNASILKQYQQYYSQWKNLQTQLSQLQKTADKQLSELDYLKFQFQQLEEAHLSENEQDDLEMELETLSHTEEIKQELQKAVFLLTDEQKSLVLLKEVIDAVGRIKSYISEGENWHKRLESVYIELKDIAQEITSLEENIDFHPDRLEWVDQRLNEIYTLEKKFKLSSISELLSLKENLKEELQHIESFDEEIDALKKKIAEAHKNVHQQAELLTKSRLNAVEPIEKFLKEQLSRLGMPNIQFKVEITDAAEFSETGKDTVQFLFSANKNQSLQPVAQIASGGEVSRLMLSIKSLMAHRAGLPTIIFDEIDTGVSGEIAHRMAEIMKEMSKNMQVIAITHLPQIAAKGNQHYRVFKDDSGKTTQTHINLLDREERIWEVAQMLSGENVTEVALGNAKELLKSE